MVATLRLFAIASVAPAVVGLSQVQKKRTRAGHKGITGPSHAANERTGIANPFGAFFKKADKLATSDEQESLEGLSTGQHSASQEKTAAKEQPQAEATLTKTKPSGSTRLADMKSVKAAAEERKFATDDIKWVTKVSDEARAKVHSPVFEEMCRGMVDCKLSVCRWLQLSEEDTGAGPCNLFEKNLNTCSGWVAPEARVDQAQAEEPPPIDCAVSVLRTGSVGPALVPEKVAQLESCLDELPEGSMESCTVALTLLSDSVAEWRKLQALDVELGEIHAALDAQMPRARNALTAKDDEQMAAAAALRPVVARAANLTSEALLTDLAGARDLLTKLDKVPLAREQLKAAMRRAEASFEANNLFKVKEAIAWLDVALMEGAKTKVDVGPPLPAAKLMVVRLEGLQMALEELATSTQVANVSLQSKSSVEKGLQDLSAAVEHSQAAGLKPAGLKEAEALVKKLRELHSAVQTLEARTGAARAVLVEGGDKGMDSLRTTLRSLNHSVLKAEGLGLEDNASVTGAVDVLDSLAYTYAARQKLHSTLEAAQDILLQDGDDLSDAKEEAMIDLITPAIAWGKEVGITAGIPAAEEALLRLKHMQHLKTRMRTALAQGNKSLESKGGIVMAKSMLGEALRVEGAKNQKFHFEVTAGQNLATSLVEKLTALIEARGNLRKAESAVNGTIKKNLGYKEAATRLNESIAAAAELGLDKEADLAGKKLDRLQSFIDAKEALLQAVAFAAPRRPKELVEVSDTVTHARFNKSALQPKDLGDISDFADDKDADFNEHIEALQKAIADAAADGFVDPKQQRALALAGAAKRASGLLKEALRDGAVALTFKEGVVEAIMKLRSAMVDAEQAGIDIDVSSARDLLKKLIPLEPARAELVGAELQGSASMKTEQQLAKASVRLHEAIDLNDHLHLNGSLKAAHVMSVKVDALNEALLDVKAAIISGEEAVKTDVGIEDAIGELSQAVAQARRVNLTRDVATARELLTELTNMESITGEVQQSLNP